MENTEQQTNATEVVESNVVKPNKNEKYIKIDLNIDIPLYFIFLKSDTLYIKYIYENPLLPCQKKRKNIFKTYTNTIKLISEKNITNYYIEFFKIKDNEKQLISRLHIPNIFSIIKNIGPVKQTS